MKHDIQEALSKINENNEEDNRNELEEQWLAELIQRKKLEDESQKEQQQEEVKHSKITKQHSKKYIIREGNSESEVVADRGNDVISESNQLDKVQMLNIQNELASPLV